MAAGVARGLPRLPRFRCQRGCGAGHAAPFAELAPPPYPLAVNQLPFPDRRHYEAATGWLMLGDAPSALAELNQLSAASRANLEVLQLEWGIHAERLDWAAATATAQHLTEAAPDCAFGWIHRAYALRRMPGGGVSRAWEVLQPALERFPKSQIIAYNLACYAAQMDRLDQAWALFQRALAVTPKLGHLLRMALSDEDLKPLWPRIRATAKR